MNPPVLQRPIGNAKYSSTVTNHACCHMQLGRVGMRLANSIENCSCKLQPITSKFTIHVVCWLRVYTPLEEERQKIMWTQWVVTIRCVWFYLLSIWEGERKLGRKMVNWLQKVVIQHFIAINRSVNYLPLQKYGLSP